MAPKLFLVIALVIPAYLCAPNPQYGNGTNADNGPRQCKDISGYR